MEANSLLYMKSQKTGKVQAQIIHSFSIQYLQERID